MIFFIYINGPLYLNIKQIFAWLIPIKFEKKYFHVSLVYCTVYGVFLVNSVLDEKKKKYTNF